MAKLYTVSLDEAERLLLEETARHPTAPNRLTTRARILLVADHGENGPGWTDTAIAEAFALSVPTIERVRKRAATEGIEAVLEERRHRATPGKVDGAQEARLTALACSDPPKGRERWTLHLLAETFGTQDGGAQISYETVRRILKKTDCRLI
jgi:transposase